MDTEQRKATLIALLKDLARITDPERGHIEADDALLEYIGDPDITAAFRTLTKWYA